MGETCREVEETGNLKQAMVTERSLEGVLVSRQGVRYDGREKTVKD